ncbi:MAG: penicillin-binding protein 2 [Planctomycetota bacterium]|nr:penicillin-binding protein 2 [Planctomycetota bacterium]
MPDQRTLPGKWRYNVVFGLLILAVAALGVRLVLLINNCPVDAADLAEKQQRRVIKLPARQGVIFARTRGGYVPLAVSRQVPSCYVDPFILRAEEIGDTAVAVGQVLGLDPVAVQEKLIRRRRARFVWLKRRITPAEVEGIRRLRNRAVGIQYEWRRHYPNGQLASTVVGFCNHESAAGGGLELAMYEHIAASDGRRVVLTDARRRPIWPLPEQSSLPQDGRNVFLCLDAVVQGFLEQAVRESVETFSAKWGTGIVVRPRTGEILAMCSVPMFDPNTFNRATPASRTNRAITMPYEPGSAIKPIFAAAAVEAGAADYKTQIFCENGSYRAHRGGRISDHGQNYGHLSLTDVVVYSSNIGMAKVGERLGNSRLHEAARGFGFGAKLGVELPGESGGILRPLAKWNGYSLRRVPFGQEISCTALQLTMAFSSLANGGLLLRPYLVDRVTNADGQVVYHSRRQVVRRVLSRPVADQSLEVLRQVVERGTGKACRMKYWTSFGKTGTAQISGPGGYAEGAYVGSFIGGAPARTPQAVCLISIYWPDRSRGYYGAKVAAPYVKDVLERTLSYLNVPPDKNTYACR